MFVKTWDLACERFTCVGSLDRMLIGLAGLAENYQDYSR